MSLKEIIELISFDLILEGLGTVFGIGLIMMMVFNGMLGEIIELLILLMC